MTDVNRLMKRCIVAADGLRAAQRDESLGKLVAFWSAQYDEKRKDLEEALTSVK